MPKNFLEPVEGKTHSDWSVVVTGVQNRWTSLVAAAQFHLPIQGLSRSLTATTHEGRWPA